MNRKLKQKIGKIDITWKQPYIVNYAATYCLEIENSRKTSTIFKFIVFDLLNFSLLVMYSNY